MIIPRAVDFLPGLESPDLYVPRPIVELKGETCSLWDDIIRERLRPLRSHYPNSLEGQVVLDGWET